MVVLHPVINNRESEIIRNAEILTIASPSMKKFQFLI
jgi:hypothetical protein